MIPQNFTDHKVFENYVNKREQLFLGNLRNPNSKLTLVFIYLSELVINNNV